MSSNYRPPYKLTPAILKLVGEISEWIGRYSVVSESSMTPRLRRGNRIRTIQSSLAIENNTLSLEQVTAVIEGKRILGDPREIQEVRNAFKVYENLDSYEPFSHDNFLDAHKTLMLGLVDNSGKLRTGAVGIARGNKIIHTAPPADRVPFLMKDLLSWLKKTDEHPLVSSCVFHYELEFIHPFKDGNGRMGRLWKTLILSKWQAVFAYLPIESVIIENQNEYYQILSLCDNKGDSTLFIEFLLDVILKTLKFAAETPEVAPDVTPEVKKLLFVMDKELTRREIQAKLGLKDEKHFRIKYQQAAVAQKLVEMTIPDKPNSRPQKYRLTEKGRIMQEHINHEIQKNHKNSKND